MVRLGNSKPIIMAICLAFGLVVLGCAGPAAPTTPPGASPTPAKSGVASPVATAAKPQDTPSPAPGAAAKQFDGEVPIGFMGPLTGPLAAVGQDSLRGIELAVDQVNEKGGIVVGGKRYKINVVKYDDQARPDVAVSLARRLRSADNVRVVVGPLFSSPSLAVLEINESEGFLMFSGATANDLTARGNKLVVRAQSTSKAYAARLAEAVAGKEAVKSWAVVANNTDFGKGWTADLTDMLPKYGSAVVTSEWIDESKQDFSAQLSNVIRKKPELIQVVAMENASALVVKQARDLGYQGPFSFATAMYEGVGMAGGWNVIGRPAYMVASFNQSDPKYVTYAQQYQKKYGSPALQYGPAFANDALLGIYAMEKAGTITEVDKIRAAVPDVIGRVNNESIIQVLSIERDGDVKEAPPILKHVGDGNLEVLLK